MELSYLMTELCKAGRSFCLVLLLATYIFTCKAIPLRAILQKFNCFPVRNYSAIPRNKMVQTETSIARNGIPFGNPSATDNNI